MKIVIAGYGVQGKKRLKYIDSETKVVSLVDPFIKNIKNKSLKDVPLDSYDTVFICTPDSYKEELINFCVKNKKNILVEKPLLVNDYKKLLALKKQINNKNIVLYSAYNHRFEPHIKTLKKILDTKKMGKIYSCRLFYGNGTARLVKDSKWRDKKSGVFADLSPHLMDISCFLFGINIIKNIDLVSVNYYENKAPDHVIAKNSKHPINLQLEMTYCMWKNDFACDIICQKGSLHINSLCKWGPSILTIRKRRYPSGKPSERKKIIVSQDPTWFEEFKYFKNLIKQKKICNLDKDLMIYKNIKKIENEIKKK